MHATIRSVTNDIAALKYNTAIAALMAWLNALERRKEGVTRTELRTGRLVPELGWADTVQLGIDQGPIVLMIENWRSDFVWKVMRRNPYIRDGLEKAGFTGGWLDASVH